MMSKVGSKTGGSSAAGGINEMPDLDAPTQGDRSSKKTSKKKTVTSFLEVQYCKYLLNVVNAVKNVVKNVVKNPHYIS